MPRKEREVLTLQCKLTEEELRNKSTEHVDLLNDIDQLESDRKSMDKSMKAQIAEKEQQEIVLREQVSTGREYRKVECRIEWDWEKKTKRWIRTDTNVTAKEEPISDFELQEELKLREKQEAEATEQPHEEDGNSNSIEFSDPSNPEDSVQFESGEEVVDQGANTQENEEISVPEE